MKATTLTCSSELEHWSQKSGLVSLNPHIEGLKKKNIPGRKTNEYVRCIDSEILRY
jgi:hypothetical protein